MKNALYLFALLLFIFSLPACSGHQHSGEVKTDNGKLWKANPETTSGIAKMQTIMGQYQAKELTMDDRAHMREDLENEFQSIFKQCTMTGEAHNQLHNYLFPMKKIFEQIDAKNPEESDLAISELKQHLTDYKNYFE